MTVYAPSYKSPAITLPTGVKMLLLKNSRRSPSHTTIIIEKKKIFVKFIFQSFPLKILYIVGIFSA
jgi:hypothetical protein